MIREKFGMEVHVPKWKESLSLKAREVVREEGPAEVMPPEISQAMLNKVIDLEHEIEKLKKRLKEKDEKATITDEDVSKLEYIQEELQGILPE
jgi:metallo-beta-lactamase family protein